MLELMGITFTAPFVLIALGILPTILLLLRLTPPAPRLVHFPAIRLMTGLTASERTPARTPLWLVILRALILTLLVMALAGPFIGPSERLSESGPLLLVVDNGWASATHWNARQAWMHHYIERSRRDERQVMVMSTAPGADGQAPQLLGPMPPARAMAWADGLTPLPWETDRQAAGSALMRATVTEQSFGVWLSDGLDGTAAIDLSLRLQRFGNVTVHVPDKSVLPLALTGAENVGGSLTIVASRAEAGTLQPVAAVLLGDDGRHLATTGGVFTAGATEAELPFDLPADLLNRAGRVTLEGVAGVASVMLLDERWRRRPVGLVAGSRTLSGQRYLSNTYYIRRALRPFADLTEGTLEEMIGQENIAVLILADVGGLTPDQQSRLSEWVEAGGVLIRFAGPSVARAGDDLLPVRLRFGDRTLGGVMSWSTPAKLAPMLETGPLHGLVAPDDVTVSRQILAEPGIDMADKSWANLADGTPLVTADMRGRGWLVLVHTTANPEWSNLALSGLFVEMLRRFVGLSAGIEGGGGGRNALQPLHLLDAMGQSCDPTPFARALDADAFDDQTPSPRHPPGLYGSDTQFKAFNLGPSLADLKPLGTMPPGIAVRDYALTTGLDLAPPLFALVFVLMVVDLFISLVLRGLLVLPATRRAALLALFVIFAATPAAAWTPSDVTPQEASSDTYLAYVLTGIPAVDDVSRAGLTALGKRLSERTSIEVAGVLGIDAESDPLAFFPLLYWPVTNAGTTLSQTAQARLNAFMRDGGTLFFDTGAGFGNQAERALRQLAAWLDIPPLTPVPADHVLTKAFYLLQDFPGRFTRAPLWVESSVREQNDGVSSVIVGGNAYAQGWATDAYGRPLYPAVPGGERQREMAYRFGINLYMYAYAGNYKSDQVHLPFIIERLGR
ncbi:MAG: DUF4159 domain-containing protein [Pseudomonadota bacterium]|nr:DUF4159 domain-containing protein [Pseudomonadota bacterium]